MDIWYALIKVIFGLYRLFFIRRVKVCGLEKLPSGPKILVANHPNMTDAFVMPFIFSEKLTFLIQSLRSTDSENGTEDSTVYGRK